MSTEQKADALQPSTSLCAPSDHDNLPALPILESGTTSSQSSNCTPLSSTNSSDPELNDSLHALLNMCSGEAVSDGMTPSSFDLFHFPFSLIPLLHSTELPSRGVSQPASIEQVLDTLQPPTSSAQSHLSSLACLYPSPMANSNLPLPPKPNTALPSSAYSDPEMCTFNNENSSTEKMTTEMEYLFDLFPLIPLPQSTELPSQGMSQPPSAEQGVDRSTVHSTVCGSLHTLTILDSSTTSQQPSNCSPVSSTPEPETNSALNALIDDKVCSQEDKMASGDMTPSISDLSLFLFPLSPLLHSTELPSRGVSQPASIEQVLDTLQPPTSSAQSHLSSYSDPEVCTVNENSNREKMAPEMGCIFDLFPLIPLSQITDLPSHGVSQPTSMEKRANMLQPPTSSAPPHLLPGDQVTDMQREKSSPSPQCSDSSVPEDEDITPVCTHINPDPPGIPAESLCIQSASTEQSIARSFSPVPPSAYHNVMTEESSTETPSRTGADSSVKAQNCMNKKQKLEIVSVVTEKQQQQRRLNNVSALHYRQRRKERERDLKVRMKQLGAKNKGLKMQLSALTTEIDKMKKLSQKMLQNTQKTKVCPFFLNSTCSKLN